MQDASDRPEALLLELSGVGRCFDDTAGRLDVLAGLDLAVRQGQSLAVVGPSGSGKSTLLNLLAGIDRPTAGRIVFDGRDMSAMTEREFSALRRDHIGMVFQLHHLLGHLTVLENVLLPALGRDIKAAEDTAWRLLRRVGIEAKARSRPGRLSIGQRQRAAVVRALINGPRLVLADEPTGSLDSRSAGELAELLVQLNAEQGVALVVATHSMPLAARMGGVMELVDGRLRKVR